MMGIDPNAEPFVVIVSGLPRSGTSMMMKMLESGGVPVLADDQRKADIDNVNGYYDSLIEFLDGSVQLGMTSVTARELLIVDSDPERLIDLLLPQGV